MERHDIARRIKAGGYRRQKTYDTFGFILTEEQVIPSARMEDIDLDAFRVFLRTQGLDTEEEPQPAIADDLCAIGAFWPSSTMPCARRSTG